MPIDLKSTRRVFRVHDESGHEFELVTEYDPESGWGASIYLGGFGMKTEDAAIYKVIKAAKEFIRIAKEESE